MDCRHLGRVDTHPALFHVRPDRRQDPPPITHPGFYYGFVTVGLAFQIAFIVIARDPVRLRPVMVPSMLEKFGGGSTFAVLYLQHRLTSGDLALGCIDLLFGVLFVAAFLKTPK